MLMPRKTSKKIRAVWKVKADKGKRVSSSISYGYRKSEDDPKQWIVDEPSARVVRRRISKETERRKIPANKIPRKGKYP